MPRKTRTTLFIILAFLFLGLTGCQGATEIHEEATAEPAEEVAPAPKDASVMSEETVEENYCLDCHGDKDRLIDTAKPFVEVVSENEGAG